MKFTLTKRNLLFLTLFSFYASCGREDIFDDRRDLMVQTCHESYPKKMIEGEKNGPEQA